MGENVQIYIASGYVKKWALSLIASENGDLKELFGSKSGSQYFLKLETYTYPSIQHFPLENLSRRNRSAGIKDVDTGFLQQH